MREFNLYLFVAVQEQQNIVGHATEWTMCQHVVAKELNSNYTLLFRVAISKPCCHNAATHSIFILAPTDACISTSESLRHANHCSNIILQVPMMQDSCALHPSPEPLCDTMHATATHSLLQIVPSVIQPESCMLTDAEQTTYICLLTSLGQQNIVAVLLQYAVSCCATKRVCHMRARPTCQPHMRCTI